MIIPNMMYGTVVNIADPEENCRYQVRIHEIHAKTIPDEHLPWCYALTSALSGSKQGEGKSSTGLRAGDEVLCFFRDKSMQEPVIAFTWYGDEDINPLVKGQDSEATKARRDNKTDVQTTGVEFTEPVTDYSQTKYPYNMVEMTRSGHVIELDDTEGHERMAWQHRLGSYREWQSDGTSIDKTVADRYEITDGDRNSHVGGRSKHNQTGAHSAKYGATFYVKAAELGTLVGSNVLIKADDVVELRAAILNVIAELKVSESITVPLLKAGTIKCDDMEVKNMINGNIKYALKSGIAGGLGPAQPAKAGGPGDTSTNPKLKDTDGY